MDWLKSVFRPSSWNQPSLPILVLILSLAATIVGWHYATRLAARDQQAHFQELLGLSQRSLHERLRHEEELLQAGRVLYHASDQVTEADFSQMIRWLDMEQRHPDVLALAFIRYRGPASNESLQLMLEEVQPDGVLRETPGQSLLFDQNTLDLLWQIAGQNDCRMTLGLEMTPRVDKRVTGTIFMPVYRTELPLLTPTDRKQAIEGWMAAVVRFDWMIQGLLSQLPAGVNLEVYDRTQPDSLYHLYAPPMSDEPKLDSRGRPLVTQSQLFVYGRTWQLRLSARPEYPMEYRFLPVMVLVSATVCSLLLFALLSSWGHTAIRARELAQRMTLHLHQSRAEAAKLACVAARTDNGVIIGDERHRIAWINPGMVRITGYSLADMQGRDPIDMLSGPETAADTVRKIRATMHRLESGQFEIRLKRHDGHYFWAIMDIQPIADESFGLPTHYIGVLRDITDWKQSQIQLLHNSTHDALTGLPNRVQLLERLEQSLQRSRRESEYFFALLFMDLDRFKIINDSLGHVVGDRLLMHMAKLIRQSLMEYPANLQATIARLGGDEFTVLLENLEDPTDAIRVASKLASDISRPCRIDGQEVVTTASIGIAFSDGQYHQAEDVLRDADNAMYRAKQTGPGRQAVFNDHMHHQISHRLGIENDLRRGLERGEFELYYQPIVDLNQRRLAGFEALVRWSHPQKGMIPPMLFVPVAEEMGLIVPLGRWVMLEAARRLARWQARHPMQPPLTMSVNLSVKQLADPRLCEHIALVIASTGLDPTTLKLEITESAVMENTQQAMDLLAQIKMLKVGLHLDDFGTGYSSLSCLHQFPLDGLKIDKSFVQSMEQRPDYESIIQTIVTLAHKLNMKVVAEGIETQQQMEQLHRLACDHGQGYLYAKPMPASQVDSFIEHFGQLPPKITADIVKAGRQTVGQ